MDSRQILFARFRLKHEALRQFKVFVMDFPYWNAIDQFLGVMAKNPDRIKEKESEGYCFDYRELPPFARLNSALVLTFGNLIQGFETYAKKVFRAGYERNMSPRRMIAFVLQSDETGSMKPDTSKIADIVEEWLSEWVETCFIKGRFGDELALHDNAGQKAYRTLITAVRNTSIIWDEINAADLWEKQEVKETKPLHRLAYNALPSLIAGLFVEKTHSKTLQLEGVDKRLLIDEWWLTQQGGKDNRHLAVLSEPILWVDGKKEGKFSYLLEFVVQTQAGNHEPWVAVYVRIRRWGTKPLKKKNPDRDISVYLRSRSAWIEGYPYSGTLVELKLSGTYYKDKKKIDSKLDWVENPSSLIQRLKGGKGRGLAKPDDIVSHPFAHQSGLASYQDEYHILHAEGMDYEGAGKGHPVNTGLALKERGQFMTFIIGYLQDYLIPDTPMKVDPLATLQVKQVKGKLWNSIRGNPVEALFTHEDLESVSLLERGSTDDEKILKKMQMTVDALMRGSGKRKIRILTFYRGEGGRLVLPHYTRKMLFLNENTELPAIIELVEPIPIIPEALGDAPATAYKEKHGRDRQRYIQKEWRKKRDEWKEFLNGYIEDDAYHLAFIEMDTAPFGLEDCSAWLKQAMRNAAIQVGIDTQMINSIPADALQKTVLRASDLSRVINANNDLILRQTALSYGLPSQIYRLAGLSDDMANSLITIGLYRYIANKPLNIGYPLAIVSTPSGETWVILPDEDGNLCEPVRYIEAGIHIGRIFAQERKPQEKKRLLNYYDEKGGKNGYRLRHFAEQILLKAQSWNQPCLVIMEAEWRGVIPIGNEKLKRNELTLNNNIYTPEKLSNLRLVRMRDVGTLNETPQYVELREGTTWQDSHDADDPEVMTGVVDMHCNSDFLHYFSIGRQSEILANRSQKIEKEIGAGWNELPTFEGNEAHKHQQAIEFVPFFMQEDDDKLTYCRIAHFLRYSPAWRGGNLVLPYQLHLAMKLINDLFDVFEPKL